MTHPHAWPEYEAMFDRDWDEHHHELQSLHAVPSSACSGPAAESEPGGWPDPLARAKRPTGTPGRMARTGTPEPGPVNQAAGPNLTDHDNAPAPRDRPGA